MRRRDLVPAILGIVAGCRDAVEPRASGLGGCALLLHIATGRLLVTDGADAARLWVAPPGSTIKPFSLLALMEAGLLRPDEKYLCPRHLVLNGRILDCSHPYIALPMNVSRAIAYSCNCAVAHFALRFRTGDLSQALARRGLCSQTHLLQAAEAIGRVDTASAGPPSQLQALGENGITVTPLELLVAYKRLALTAADPPVQAIIQGLEDAVAFGTSQGARLDHVSVAGKTGSVVTASGSPAAWFAGFAPSRTPEVAAVVLVQGRSGGGDAAPLAGRLLKDHFAGRA